jgi:serine/threonine-protein kinase
MVLHSGATFAGYTVARRLGSGMTGDVYLVLDPQRERWQALKILPPTTNSKYRERFAAETPLAANLHHPHIVEVQERGQFEGQLYVAMEYVESSNAAQIMDDSFPAVLPVGEVLAIVTAIADALDYAHERGLLHRDVKPASIVLTGRGEQQQRILLTDFGLAPQLGETETDVADVPVGTIAYAAPEQLSGAGIDRRTDQYALAATAFHLLTGAPLMEGSDSDAALRQLLSGAPRLVSDQRPELECLDRVFAKALAANPGDRFENCRAFARAANEQAGNAIAAAPTWAESGDTSRTGPSSAPQPGAGHPRSRAAKKPSAVAALARRPDDAATAGPAPAAPAGRTEVSVPLRRRPRKVVLGAAAVVLVAGMLTLGIVIGRITESTPKRAANPAPAPAAGVGAPTTPASTPPGIQLDGSYRLEAQRTKQTYNYVGDPQPPDVMTWWGFRSSCTPHACTAAATQLDDNDHIRAMSPGGGVLFMQFTDGQWQSQPMDLDFPCVGPDGSQATQSVTLVVTLRPQPPSGFVGEETVTVQTNECGQRSAVIRIPTFASRKGEVPPGVAVPDPPKPSENLPSPAPH